MFPFLSYHSASHFAILFFPSWKKGICRVLPLPEFPKCPMVGEAGLETCPGSLAELQGHPGSMPSVRTAGTFSPTPFPGATEGLPGLPCLVPGVSAWLHPSSPRGGQAAAVPEQGAPASFCFLQRVLRTCSLLGASAASPARRETWGSQLTSQSCRNS